jgi:hypothetical protein
MDHAQLEAALINLAKCPRRHAAGRAGSRSRPATPTSTPDALLAYQDPASAVGWRTPNGRELPEISFYFVF